MKKIAFTLFTVLFSASILFAVKPAPIGDPVKKSTVLQDDLNAFDQELEGLQSLEKLVSEKDLTAEQLKEANNGLIDFLDENASVENSILSMAAPDDERPLGIGGFLWGFCLGWVGILIVYLAIDDPELKKKEGRNAIIGCLVSGLIVGILYGIAIASQIQ